MFFGWLCASVSRNAFRAKAKSQSLLFENTNFHFKYCRLGLMFLEVVLKSLYY